MKSTNLAVYIAGPMRGIPEFNFPAFDAAETAVRASGRVVNLFNPAARDRDKYGPAVNASPTGDENDAAVKSTGFNLREALGADLDYVCRIATTVVVLPGWEASKGARAEVATAKALGLDVTTLDSFVDADLVDHDPTSWQADELIPLPETPEDPRSSRTDETGAFDGHVARLADLGLLDDHADGLPTASGEVRVTSSTGGEKGSKPARFDLIPAAPLWTVAELYGKGAEKYAARNWERGYAWSLSYAALMRHVSLWWQGHDLDDETGLPHLASVVFHALAGLEFATTHPEFDDRPKTPGTFAAAVRAARRHVTATGGPTYTGLPAEELAACVIPGDPEYDRYRKDTAA